MYLDLFIAIPIAWGMFRGLRRGFIIELCTLMALVLGIYGAATFGDMAGQYLESSFNTEPRLSLVLAFTIVFILIVVVVFIFGRVLEKVIKMVALGLINKLFGMIFGGLKFALIVSSLFFIINGFPLLEKFVSPELKKESYLYEPVSQVAIKLFPILKNRSWMDEIEKRFENLKKNVEKL